MAVAASSTFQERVSCYEITALLDSFISMDLNGLDSRFFFIVFLCLRLITHGEKNCTWPLTNWTHSDHLRLV